VRLYDTLFTVARPDDADDDTSVLNPASLEVVQGARVEPALAGVAPETRVQFERTGYFVADWHDHRRDRPVFNRTVGLRDTWAKIESKGPGAAGA
jgi:glutaminyl-tRNA synthetase